MTNFLDDDQVHVDVAVATERHTEASTSVSSGRTWPFYLNEYQWLVILIMST